MNLQRKHWLAIGGGGLLLAAAALGAVVLWGSTPEPQSDKPEDLVAFIATEDFARLPENKQQQYLTKLRESDGDRREAFRTVRDLPEEQRRQFHQNMRQQFQQRMEQHIDEYFALPPEQRQAKLDETIDHMLARRKEFEARRAQRRQQASTRPRSEGNNTSSRDGNADRRQRSGRRRGDPAERLKRRIEHSNPERRAKFVEYMKQMRKRMEERGIEPPRRGPRPR